MIAAALGAITAINIESGEFRVPLALYAILGVGVPLWVADSVWLEYKQAKNLSSLSYRRAVRLFMGVLKQQGTDYEGALSVAPIPEYDPVSGWQKLGPDNRLRLMLERLSAAGEGDDFWEARNEMKATYADWNSKLKRRIPIVGFKRELHGAARLHKEVFKLWLFYECAYASEVELGHPSFTPYQRLIKEWFPKREVTVTRKKEPTQKTKKGKEIPIPKRKEFLDNLETVAKEPADDSDASVRRKKK